MTQTGWHQSNPRPVLPREEGGRREKILRLPRPEGLPIHESNAAARLKAAGVPDDVLLVGIHTDRLTATWCYVLEHGSYPLVPWGAEAPIYGPGDAGLLPNR